MDFVSEGSPARSIVFLVTIILILVLFTTQISSLCSCPSYFNKSDQFTGVTCSFRLDLCHSSREVGKGKKSVANDVEKVGVTSYPLLRKYLVFALQPLHADRPQPVSSVFFLFCFNALDTQL